MVDKIREAYLRSLEVGKRHHSRGSVIAEKHWISIDEVADGGLGSSLSVIDLGRKDMLWNVQLVAEKAHFIRFGFQVSPLRVRQHKIEHSDAPLDVFDFVLS